MPVVLEKAILKQKTITKTKSTEQNGVEPVELCRAPTKSDVIPEMRRTGLPEAATMRNRARFATSGST